MSSVFAQINQGNVTAGLRKVTKEMKTKYQPNKPSGLVPAKEEKETGSKTSEPKTAPKRPPRLVLEGNKWIVVRIVSLSLSHSLLLTQTHLQTNLITCFNMQEYQVGNRDIVIDIKDIKETVYIFRCENSLIRINGKVNSIAIGK